jgi:hypothetical protein
LIITIIGLKQGGVVANRKFKAGFGATGAHIFVAECRSIGVAGRDKMK